MANGTPLGFESKLWAAADALRNNMDAAEYKHVVLGLIFLEYISDAFEARYEYLRAAVNNPENDYFLRPDLPNRSEEIGRLLEDKDEYTSLSIFWVPKEARWSFLRDNAPQPTIGKIVDDAMSAIERDNPSLKGVLPKDFGRPGLDKQRLGQLINLVSDIGLGSPADRAKDVLGHVYEYFLAQFASAEGKKGGQFYTPSWVVRVLVEMLAPYKGRVYDPCCGSGGMFVSSEKFIEAHSGKIGDISIYGQESNYTTWRLAKMNLAIRGIDAQIAVPHEAAMRILDDVGFFQAVRSVLAKSTTQHQRSEEYLDHAIRQIVSRAVVSEGVVDIFAAAGLKKPDISILSEEFLAELSHLPQKNLAVELVRKLLNDEIKVRSRRNVIESRRFSELLASSIRKYQNRAIEAAQVIEELIGLARNMREAAGRGEKLKLSDDEVAFYDALEVNDSAVKVLGDETLKTIARELVATVQKNTTIDWTVRENVRAHLRVLVKRILRKYGYPPDKQEKATFTVLEQAEALSANWALA